MLAVLGCGAPYFTGESEGCCVWGAWDGCVATGGRVALGSSRFLEATWYTKTGIVRRED